MTLSILVTGANGFVGGAVCRVLEAAGHRVRRAVRSCGGEYLPPGSVAVGDIGGLTDWTTALDGIDVVVHLAARTVWGDQQDRCVSADSNPATVIHTHDPYSIAPESGTMTWFHHVNALGTRRLAAMAAAARVRRLVFMSCDGMNVRFAGDQPLEDIVELRASDPYRASKIEAEAWVQEVGAENNLDVVILRPGLVYGPGAKGMFAMLFDAVDRNTRLEFEDLDGQVTLVGVENLADAVRLCLDRPAAAGRTYVVSDAENVTLRDLVTTITEVLGYVSPLPTVDREVTKGWFQRKLRRTARERPSPIAQFPESSGVGPVRIREELGWQPVISYRQGIEDMVRAYQARREIN